MRLCHFSLIILLLLTIISAVLVRAQPRPVVILEINGNIDEGKVYLVRRAASIADSGVLVIVINSYGGYISSMDEIISILKACPCITVAFIPTGAKAVSAAAGVALAVDKLYLGKGSVIGGCKPIPADEKIQEYMVARIKSLMEEKNVSNPDIIAQELVIESRTFTVKEAVEAGLALGEAASLQDVLRREGLENTTAHYITSDLISDLLSLIVDPGVALLFIVLGVLLIALEFHVTGFQGWGILGVILILTALYTFNIIGVNLFAFLLLSTGIILILLELFKPGIQLFGLAGGIFVSLAVAIEYYTQPYITISNLTLTALVILGLIGVFIGFIILKASETLRLKATSLEERLVGKRGQAKTEIKPGKRGVVIVESEEWTAESDEEIHAGENIVVVEVKGLILRVGKAQDK
ncbi:MAG: NfeD family protein [Infirmifilum sp.]